MAEHVVPLPHVSGPWRIPLAFDRDATLKKAEKLLRQGRLEPAIAEYVRVVEEFPRDWSTANTLGELYARAGQPQQAVGQYARIAQHFVDEGFYPEGRRALQEDPQAPAPGRDHPDPARRHLGAAGAARRRQVASERHRRAPPRQGRSPRRRRNRRAARHHRPDRLRGQARRRPDARGDGRGGGGRQAVQGPARRSAREGPDRRGDRRAQGVCPHQPARTRGPLDAGEGRARAGRPRPAPASSSTRTARATIRRCCCRWPRSSCDRAS